MKLTDKHFEIFAKAVCRWQTDFGLIGYRITVQWEENDDSNALAYVRVGVKSREASVFLCRDWGKVAPTDERLNETAFHELLHIVLGDLVRVAEKSAPRSMYNTIQAMEHNVIRVLENVVFRFIKQK